MIKISVIMPSLNVIKYIDECIKSVLSQSLDDIEIICVDAGSTDGTYELLEEYEKKDKRIKLIKSNYKSYGYQMNIGISVAKGKYIGVVETDDYVDTQMFEKLYKRAIQCGADVVKADHWKFYGTENKKIRDNLWNANDIDLYSKVSNYREDNRILNMSVFTWAGIYKRDFLNNNNIMHNETPGASFQDNGFWLQIVMCAERVAFVHEPLYFLRRDNSDSSIYSKNKINCYREEYQFMRDCILKRNVDTKKLLQFLWTRKYLIMEADIARNRYDIRKDIINNYSDDFAYAIDSNELYDDGNNSNLISQIKLLIMNPEEYYDKYYKVSEYAYRKISDSQTIYIYGTGNYAYKTFTLINGIDGMDQKLQGFIVSEVNKNLLFFRNKPVKSYKEVNDIKNSLVIIGLSYKYQNDVKIELKNIGFKNILLYSELNEYGANREKSSV